MNNGTLKRWSRIALVVAAVLTTAVAWSGLSLHYLLPWLF